LNTVAGKRRAMTDDEAPQEDPPSTDGADDAVPPSSRPSTATDEAASASQSAEEPSAGSASAQNSPSTGQSAGEPPSATRATDGSAEKPSAEPAAHADGDAGLDKDAGLVTRFRESNSTPVVFVRETLSSALIVVVIGLVLFGLSGIWPPMVAVESGSMEPHMEKGDLIFVTEPGRYAPDAAYGQTGVVTHEVGSETGYSTFGAAGSVIVYTQPDRFGPPIIHRARLFVEEGENWYDRANPDYLPGDSCSEIPHCPAPHSGFITKGDNNRMYDQVNTIDAPPVKPSWIRGVARVRIPLLGWIRLVFSGAATTTPAPGPELGVVAATDSGPIAVGGSGIEDVGNGSVGAGGVDHGGGGVGSVDAAAVRAA
jgi:signal peptidase